MAPPHPREETTELLLALRAGERDALDRLIPRVYDELQILAHRALARGVMDGALRTTGLVREAYLKLVDAERVHADDRAHFLALAAKAMRHIVIDRARRGRARKRGGGLQRVPLGEAQPAVEDRTEDVLEVDEALGRLERFDPMLCRVVECRFFGGLTVEETSAALGVSPRTVDRMWTKARAWLSREIDEA
jgi:RNA polymerase sigma factor (TIGR02999 family)